MCCRPNGLLVLFAALPACITDSVPPNIYVSEPATLSDAAVDAGASVARDANMVVDSATEPTGPTEDVDTSVSEPPMGGSGPCDLSGSWLVTQHGVFQALGVTQTSQTYLYYELATSGGVLTVTKGLSCGGRVIPLNPLGAAVQWEAAFAAQTAKNSHTGRKGKVSSDGTNCSISFDLAITIIGATVKAYLDPNVPLPTVDKPASADGTTPGWEDWDNDNNPGVSFNTTGFANGVRYSVQRVYSDWPSGTYTPGATAIRMVSVTQTDESVLGATSDLIKTLSVPDADPATGFVQLAQLDPAQAQGDDNALCATVRDLAETLTPEANSK